MIYIKFWIFGIFLILIPQTVLQEPGYESDYLEYSTKNDPIVTLTSTSSETTQYDESESDYSSYPGQGYVNEDSDRFRDANRARQLDQDDSEPSDSSRKRLSSLQSQRENYPQVNYDHINKQNIHYHHQHHVHTQDSEYEINTYHQTNPDRIQSYPFYKEESFQQDTLPVFKIQRRPDEKLGVVFNENINTNPSRRSTPKGTTTTTSRPIQQPSRRVQGGDIIFPDDLEKKRLIEPQCIESGEDFCVTVRNYPSEHVQVAIQSEIDKYEQLFGVDLINEISGPNITQRIDIPGEESLCTSVEEIIYPQAGLTKDNNWSFIVNQQNYTQGIRIEKCVNPGKPCRMAELFPNGYTTECKQNHIYRQLLSVNAEGRVVKDLFKLPSCCKCILKSSTRT